MDSPRLDDIIDLLVEQSRVPRARIMPDSDLESELGITGDDHFQLMEEFMKRFEVNMLEYRWYFHCAEEGTAIFSRIFKPPNKRVEHIPVTPAVLLQAAELRRWPLTYPAHSLPKHRWDVILSWVLMIAVGFAVYFLRLAKE